MSWLKCHVPIAVEQVLRQRPGERQGMRREVEDELVEVTRADRGGIPALQPLPRHLRAEQRGRTVLGRWAAARPVSR